MVEEIQQEIKQVSLKNEDLILSPEFLREAYTTNRYQRALSLAMGWTGDRVKFLRCMTTGVLKTAPVATGLEEYTVETGICIDAYHADDTFAYSSPYSRWDILIENKDAVISFRNKPNTDWGDDMVLTVGWHSLDMVNYGIRLHNRVNGELSTYQVVPYR